ncbi:hypothetical protein QT381_11245 [Galbitalea sp. SE-J8]|uniref:sensor histidine kinase n=1 Tax=Galbitalea sp. SE-J8 TaxID=3054952 RepID=UPI00259D0CD9|nr:ATP-binding protein [Galbitalea sp. SE-J8]MDM4763584.1 hypothetical protein [Galbitalea sp. SE-J8]
MPLGLPRHLAARSVLGAYAHGSHVAALASILLSAAVVLSVQSGQQHLSTAPAVLALAPPVALLALVERRPGLLPAVAYLAVGGACVYAFAIAATAEFTLAATTSTISVTLAKLALVLVGAGRGAPSVIAWAVAGYVVAELSAAAAAWQAGGAWEPDATTTGVLVVIAAGALVLRALPRATVVAQPAFVRAARAERLARARRRLEVRATALVHDTVLGHLAAISAAPGERLSPALVGTIRDDIALIVGGDWLAEEAPSTPPDTAVLDGIVAEARALGLELSVSGDRALIAEVPAPAALALALATRQCLANVVRHAGVDAAELVVYGSPGEVTIMVVDDGRGFAVEATPPDRLGLRHSVVERIEAVGGRAQVFSTPGRGTSVLLTVPRPGAIA